MVTAASFEGFSAAQATSPAIAINASRTNDEKAARLILVIVITSVIELLAVCGKHSRSPSTELLCGCQVTNTRVLFFSSTLYRCRPKRDLLLCVARHPAVTLT